jgi:hypothetical protein
VAVAQWRRQEGGPTAIMVNYGRKPDGESREFPVAFSGKHKWRIPGILLDIKQPRKINLAWT